MLSLTQFRKHCMPLFKLMRDTHMELEIVYKGKVYDMSIVETAKAPKLHRSKRNLNPEVKQIETETCPNCAGLMFNGICMNSQCRHATGSLRAVADETLSPSKPQL